MLNLSPGGSDEHFEVYLFLSPLATQYLDELFCKHSKSSLDWTWIPLSPKIHDLLGFDDRGTCSHIPKYPSRCQLPRKLKKVVEGSFKLPTVVSPSKWSYDKVISSVSKANLIVL